MAIITLLPAFLGNLRGAQLIILIIVVLLLFGGKRIPGLMRNIGKGINSFKQGLNDAREEINKPIKKSDESADDESKSEPSDK
ncbi:MAG: twin-arginine translocase TatA/TatE family subunit [Muribaculaceae bacterium]